MDEFRAVSMAPASSTLIFIGLGGLRPRNSAISRESQTASFAAWQDAMYSASHEEVAIVICFFDLQLTAPPAIVTTYPLVDFRDSWQRAQSESEYPSGSNLKAPWKGIP